MPQAPSPPTIVISHLAAEPTPPTAANHAWPNVLHTRIADVVRQMDAAVSEPGGYVTVTGATGRGDRRRRAFNVDYPPG